MTAELKILALLEQAKAGLAVGQIAKLLDITHHQAKGRLADWLAMEQAA